MPPAARTRPTTEWPKGLAQLNAAVTVAMSK